MKYSTRELAEVVHKESNRIKEPRALLRIKLKVVKSRVREVALNRLLKQVRNNEILIF